jgi:hypothetical protein
MPLSDKQRAKIVEVAESWYGTPYRDCSCLKGAGVDCGQLLKGVFLEAGHGREDGVPLPEVYSTQIWLHKDDTTYLDFINKYFREIPEPEVKPGDIVLYKFGRGFAHGAIIKEWANHVIHAMPEGVVGGHGKNFKFGRLEKKFFTLKDEYCDEEE